MTSRFVSGGTIAGDGGDTVSGGAAAGKDQIEGANTGDNSSSSNNKAPTNVEWETVQRDLEEERRKRADARKTAVEGGAGGERSLYEVLQANKAAKQAAFEEQNRIRNQFRALDDDEIEFLHGVTDEKRAEEERVRRETEEGLASFRKARQAVGGGGGSDAPDVGNTGIGAEEWTAVSGRKRKRGKEKAGLKGVRRRTNMAEDDKKDSEKRAGEEKGERNEDKASPVERAGNGRTELTPANSTSMKSGAVSGKAATTAASAQTTNTTAKPKPKLALGLVDYGSDEDSDG
ncbi:N-terminal domain of NEFA-interacting nuclear protein NIP30-domain-containing protein [Nemania abortiva]|nr:N-terminal domain of NEFA-interacting nuclear protein NIP30-domain-containing protein [Nemania abortiva]